MAIVKKEVSYCKELDDVLALVVGVAKDVVAHKPAAEIGAEALPALIAALSGLDAVSAEVQDYEALDTTIALRLGEIKRIFAPSVP